MERKVDRGDVTHWCGRVDFFDRANGIALEVDNEKYHTSLVDREHDFDRERRLATAGFVVIRVTDQQVWHRPSQVVAAVRSHHRRTRTRPVA